MFDIASTQICHAVDGPERVGNWRRLGGIKVPYGQATLYVFGKAKVILSLDDMGDGSRRMHLSLSHPKRLPTWDELVRAKELFMGTDVEAWQCLPRRDMYVNMHPNCLYIWAKAEQ